MIDAGVREMRGTPWERVPGDPPDEADVPVAAWTCLAVLVQQLPSVVPEREPDARGLCVRRADIEEVRRDNAVIQGAPLSCWECTRQRLEDALKQLSPLMVT